MSNELISKIENMQDELSALKLECEKHVKANEKLGLNDDEILATRLKTLEYVTYHDGRYCQEQNKNWQSDAQKLVSRLATRLGVAAYEDYK